MNRGFLRRALLTFTLLCQALPANSASETELKVAMIYNIARFVQWPRVAPAGKQFNLCTVGNNPLIDGLSVLQGKPLNDMPVAIQAVKRDADLASCQLIYIAPDDAVRLAAISNQLAATHSAALTISDAPSFIALGGMVQLVILESRQRFRINQHLAEKSGLAINAKLLQLALPGED